MGIRGVPTALGLGGLLLGVCFVVGPVTAKASPRQQDQRHRGRGPRPGGVLVLGFLLDPDTFGGPEDRPPWADVARERAEAAR